MNIKNISILCCIAFLSIAWAHSTLHAADKPSQSPLSKIPVLPSFAHLMFTTAQNYPDQSPVVIDLSPEKTNSSPIAHNKKRKKSSRVGKSQKTPPAKKQKNTTSAPAAPAVIDLENDYLPSPSKKGISNTSTTQLFSPQINNQQIIIINNSVQVSDKYPNSFANEYSDNTPPIKTDTHLESLVMSSKSNHQQEFYPCVVCERKLARHISKAGTSGIAPGVAMFSSKEALTKHYKNNHSTHST